MTLEEFNSKYIYKTDKEKFDFIEVWEIPKLQNGKYYGDCESYCRFLKNNIPEFKDWDYYYCRLNNGGGHCILLKEGKVIDCNLRSVVTLEQYFNIYLVTDLAKYHWFTVFSKILLSKGFLLWRRFFK